MKFWKPILAAVVIFAAGLVTGGLTLDLRRTPAPDPDWSDPSTVSQSPQAEGQARPREGTPRDGSFHSGPPRDGFGQPGRERHLEELCKRMERDLGLDAMQRDRVESIIRQTHERVQALVDGLRPQTHAEFRRMEEDIKGELTPEQSARFDELAEQRRQRFRR